MYLRHTYIHRNVSHGANSHFCSISLFIRRCKFPFIQIYVYDSYRCLCELAKQIGFQDQAQNIFQLEQQLSTFRHVVSIDQTPMFAYL